MSDAEGEGGEVCHSGFSCGTGRAPVHRADSAHQHDDTKHPELTTLLREEQEAQDQSDNYGSRVY
jgi:hypothetical protein